jgi:hypothetical protein
VRTDILDRVKLARYIKNRDQPVVDIDYFISARLQFISHDNVMPLFAHRLSLLHHAGL